ncbi:Spx/MgsR family RNA polymerase-binding regulatory protein [Pendulispora rubella]|uniref:Spx/MgsR family RNA polymerase-binding regulatory protein n=1 Tax=Pendulispora rubella TaxID=2741070 RepID=A0ABZ2LHP3_9BACT
MAKGKDSVTVLAYAKCSTCNNALKWLKSHGIEPEVRPIVDAPPTSAELAKWIPASGVGVRKWLNTSGQSYRALGKAKFDAASDAEIARWLTEDGKLVKRPVLVKGSQVLVGFREEAYAELFG